MQGREWALKAGAPGSKRRAWFSNRLTGNWKLTPPQSSLQSFWQYIRCSSVLSLVLHSDSVLLLPFILIAIDFSFFLCQTCCVISTHSSEMPNYDVLIPVLLKEGIDQLPNHCKLTPGKQPVGNPGTSWWVWSLEGSQVIWLSHCLKDNSDSSICFQLLFLGIRSFSTCVQN